MATYPPHSELAMPALSPTMSLGNLVEWQVTEGQAIAAGDVLAEIETDKATLSWENQDDGYVAKLLVPAGTQGIKVGQPVAIVVDEEDQIAAFKSYSTADGSVETRKDENSSGSSSEKQDSLRLAPSARHLLEEHHISIERVKPTGPHGIVTKGDVLAVIDSQVVNLKSEDKSPKFVPPPKIESPTQAKPLVEEKPAVESPSRSVQVSYVDIPTSQIRRIIAQRLIESKSSIPHMYVSSDVELDAIMQLRESLKHQNIKVSVNDCIVKAVAQALAQVPQANAIWEPSIASSTELKSIDISIAVATDSGLITPIIKRANEKTLLEISAEVKELAARARVNKLKPEEFQGGSFSISNLGMYGIDSFSAIINPPQAAIMAVGGARKIVRIASSLPETATVINVTLSADSRVYDHQITSDFLAAFSRNLANPWNLF
jgi:pyruvate dehydrogenase E2 component (dihydrolipoamide acetyltransferase)